MPKPIIAIYPGTFDPITLGHENIVKRACALFDSVIIAIASGHHKKTLFSLSERVEIAQKVFQHRKPFIQIESFSGLIQDFATKHQATVLIRGLRTTSDFDYEFQLAGVNRHLMPEVETIFLAPEDKYQFISSSFAREIASLGGKVNDFVSPVVCRALVNKFSGSTAHE
jgi:pantetheine-phosphate adenylyltransferase